MATYERAQVSTLLDRLDEAPERLKPGIGCKPGIGTSRRTRMSWTPCTRGAPLTDARSRLRGLRL